MSSAIEYLGICLTSDLRARALPTRLPLSTVPFRRNRKLCLPRTRSSCGLRDPLSFLLTARQNNSERCHMTFCRCFALFRNLSLPTRATCFECAFLDGIARKKGAVASARGARRRRTRRAGQIFRRLSLGLIARGMALRALEGTPSCPARPASCCKLGWLARDGRRTNLIDLRGREGARGVGPLSEKQTAAETSAGQPRAREERPPSCLYSERAERK